MDTWIICPAGCKKWFKSNVVSRHLNSTHADGKILSRKYICYICHIEFSRTNNLQRHQKKQHDHVLPTPPPVYYDPSTITTITTKLTPNKRAKTIKIHHTSKVKFKLAILPPRCRAESIIRHRQQEARSKDRKITSEVHGK